MPLDSSRPHAMAISSLIKDEDAYDPCYLPMPMSSSLSSTMPTSSECYSPHPFTLTPRSRSNSSFFDDPTTDVTTTGTLLLDSSGRSQSPNERRRRNKEASARYRAKRNQRNEDMRNVVAKLMHQNNVLFTALQEAYENQGRDAPRSMDEVVGLMNKTNKQHYTHDSSSMSSSYPSPPYHNNDFYPSTAISSNY